MSSKIMTEPKFCSNSTEGEFVAKSKKNSLATKMKRRFALVFTKIKHIFAPVPTPDSASVLTVNLQASLGSTPASVSTTTLETPAIMTPYETISLMVRHKPDFFSRLFTSIKKHGEQDPFLLRPFIDLIYEEPNGETRAALVHFMNSLEEAILDTTGIAFSLSWAGYGRMFVQINLTIDVVVNELTVGEYATMKAKYCGKEIGMVHFTLDNGGESAPQHLERASKD